MNENLILFGGVKIGALHVKNGTVCQDVVCLKTNANSNVIFSDKSISAFKLNCFNNYSFKNLSFKKNIKNQIKKNIKNQKNKRISDLFINNKNEKFAAIALCDGAGSAANSQLGAKISTQNICEILKNNFTNIYKNNFDKTKILNMVLEELKKVADENNIELKSLASTLLFAVIKNKKFICGHIGDGVIGIFGDFKLNNAEINDIKDDINNVDVNKKIKLLSAPQNGQYANETTFTTSINAKENFRIYCGEFITSAQDENDKNFRGFVLMSDGSAESLFSKNKLEFASALERILNINFTFRIADLFTKSLLEKVSTKTGDDCSLAVIKMLS